jgi:hypothetical protein
MVKFTPTPLESTKGKIYLYRYVDGWHVEAILNKYEIRRETPKGHWVKRWPWSSDDDLRWVPKEGRSNFAKLTKEEALENYYHRKRRQVVILQSRLEKTKQSMDWAKRKINKETEVPLLLGG